MTDEMVNWDDLSRNTFSFEGNYRAIVEDTEDPLKAGRVRVRIFGIHSPDEKITPVSSLPWAEAALSLYHSGGILNDATINDEVDQNSRYKPKKEVTSNVPARNVEKLTPATGSWTDNIMNACGSPGIYTVPRKGSIVWLFFDGANHMFPKYWAAAPRASDWEQQRLKIEEVISEKRDSIQKIKDSITIDSSEYSGKGESTKNAKVATKNKTPKLWIHQLSDVDNRDITSITSAFGSTYIIVNKQGVERLYVFNKGSAQYVDERGQTKTLIGITNNDGTEQKNDYQMLGANNLEIHLLGDYCLYAKNNVFLETEGNVEINAKNNIGIVARTGDIDIIVEKANCNIDVAGNVSIRSAGNTQIEADGDLIAKVTGNADISVQGDVISNVVGSVSVKSSEVNISSDTGVNIQSPADVSISCANFKLETTQAVSISALTSVDIQANTGILASAAGSNMALQSGQANIQATQVGINASNIGLQGQINMGSSANGGTATPPSTQSTNNVSVPSPGQFATGSTDKTIEDTPQEVSDSDN